MSNFGHFVGLAAVARIVDIPRIMSILCRFASRPFQAHVFVSHFHWDHIQGMPFFRPLYNSSESQFIFHSSARTRRLEQVMAEQMAAPYFPVDLAHMKAKRRFYDVENGCLP